MKAHFTFSEPEVLFATGSSELLNEAGVEDVARSRRVEFKIRTDAETRLAKILAVLQ